MTTKFDACFDRILNEFNVEDRNDPAFYDYIVILLQQFLQRNLLNPKKMGDLRKTAMQILKDGYFNFIDEENELSFKISFIFDDKEKSVNNLTVKIDDLLDKTELPKTIENTHEETSINDIVDYIEQKKVEKNQQGDQQPGVDVPAELSQTPPSELPQATPPATGAAPQTPSPVPNTGQYMQGQ